MKTVYFVRHAKSSWDHPGMRDIERPLNERGLRDAPFMAQLLAGKGVKLDKIISSPANRAYTTATFFASSFQIPVSDIMVHPDIYEAWPEQIMRIVHQLPDEWATVAIFGHNPTFTAIANMFADEPILNLPTCGVAQVEAPVAYWRDFQEHASPKVRYYFPKQYLP